MRKMLGLLVLLLPLSAYAVNDAELDQCREYSDPAVRGKCVQMYKRTDTRAASATCKKNLECWGERYREQAEKYCGVAFERRAASSSLWAQHWDGQDFDQVRWLDRGKGVMVYFEEESNVVLQCIFFPNAPAKVRVSLAPPR